MPFWSAQCILRIFAKVVQITAYKSHEVTIHEGVSMSCMQYEVAQAAGLYVVFDVECNADQGVVTTQRFLFSVKANFQ